MCVSVMAAYFELLRVAASSAAESGSEEVIIIILLLLLLLFIIIIIIIKNNKYIENRAEIERKRKARNSLVSSVTVMS